MSRKKITREERIDRKEGGKERKGRREDKEARRKLNK